MIGETDPSPKKKRAEKYIDSLIINRLEAEGFLDSVQRELSAK